MLRPTVTESWKAPNSFYMREVCLKSLETLEAYGKRCVFNKLLA